MILVMQKCNTNIKNNTYFVNKPEKSIKIDRDNLFNIKL